MFEAGKSYLIETLPDDLHDEGVPNKDKWALRGALFRNDCQGWWHQEVADFWLENRYRTQPVARFWSPEPPNPIEACDHEWIDIRNQHVENGSWCSRCHTLRAENVG
jgi:hypothetical protein